ncbi:MAG: hypothetical protein ACR2QG_07460 [Gammaproteobacteria bacterium]
MNKVFLRYLAYAVGVFAFMNLIMLFAWYMPGGLQFERNMPELGVQTSELSPIEVLQNILLIFCACIFAWVASRDRLRRSMAVSLAALFSIFLIRELDFFLDFYMHDNLWQVLVALVLSFALVYCVRDRHRYAQGWRRSWPSAGLALIFGGLILLLPFAQLVGHEGFWQIILGDNYIRVVKIATEEFIELGAYAIITIGTIEFFYSWSRLPRTRNFHAPLKSRW